MKKLYFTLAVAALTGSLAASAQQLPNVGFENWKTQCDSTEAFGYFNGMRQRPGVEPADWNGSSVNQFVFMEVKQELVFNAEGKEGQGVKLQNKFVGAFGIGSVAPGFINFGTPWVQANIDVANCDGGTYGGLNFNYRPDALQLDIKRGDSNDENSSIVAYLWKGHFQSKVGTISDPQFVRTDVDRAIMGRVAAEEGSDGKLIGFINDSIRTTNGDWKTLNIPFNYVSDEKPEMLNVVICSGNYWNRAALKDTTSVVVDNVKFIYHSRLQLLTINGDEVCFGPDSYELTLDEAMPAADAFVAVADGKDAKVDVKLDNANAVATITVSNVAEDFDGKTEHVYTINFKKAATGDVVKNTYKGTLTVELSGLDITEGGQDATIEISQAAGSSTCDFLLPNLTLVDLGTLGDIAVSGVNVKTDADGTNTYDGYVESMKLLDGTIDADVKVTGTITKEGDADMTINVEWYQDRNKAPIPILCKFVGKGNTSSIKTVTISNNNTVEMFDLRGNRVNADNLPAGIYIRRQGNTVTKVLVK